MEDLNKIVRLCSKINKGKEVKTDHVTAKIIIKWYSANDTEILVRINNGEYWLSKAPYKNNEKCCPTCKFDFINSGNSNDECTNCYPGFKNWELNLI